MKLRNRAVWAMASLLVLLAGASGCRDRRPEPESPTSRSDGWTAPPAPSGSAVPAGSGAASSETSVLQSPPNPKLRQGDRVLFEGSSEFSKVQVVDEGGRRSLLFVRDNGEAVIESSQWLDKPDLLDVPYTRVMFVNYLYKPRQERCVIIGLGGGSMVRFLNRFFPEVQIDVVDIDPLVVRVAAEYFGVRSNAKTHIAVEDGFKFLAAQGDPYDTIYLDAFVKPAADTDAEGMPLRLKTKQFLVSLQKRLTPDGVVVVNLNDQPNLRDDISVIRESYPHFELFPVPNTGNYIAVGSMQEVGEERMRENGRAVDQRGSYGFTFEGMVKLRARPR
jgi:spermidine synthase